MDEHLLYAASSAGLEVYTSRTMAYALHETQDYDHITKVNGLQKLILITLHKKDTIHQVTTMLATSENVLFPGHNHLLTTVADDSSQECQWGW